MRWRTGFIAALGAALGAPALLAGCATDAPGANVVTIASTAAPPRLLAYRDGAPGSIGDWQAPVQTSAATFELRVGDAYELLAVCVDAAGDVDGIERVATFSGDGPSGQIGCPVAAPVGDTGSIQGTVAAAGVVSIGGIAQASPTAQSGAWVYQIHGVPYGAHDRIAVDGTAIQIFRGEVIASAETLESPIDLAANGTPLVATPLTVTGTADGDAVATTVELTTVAGAAAIAATGVTAMLVPDALLGPGDRQGIAVSATSGNYVREAESPDASVRTFALPPRLDGVGFAPNGGGQMVASWAGGLPDVDAVVLYLDDVTSTGTGAAGDAAAYKRATVTASASWIAATGATSLAYDTSAPGFQPAWTIDAANAEPKLAVETSTPGGTFGVSLVSE